MSWGMIKNMSAPNKPVHQISTQENMNILYNSHFTPTVSKKKKYAHSFST